MGQATAIALAAHGAHVLVVGRNEQRAKGVVAEIKGGGGRASFKLTTLSDLNQPRSWSSGPLRQATVTSTSSSTTLASPCSDKQRSTEAEFDETFALNVKIPFFLVVSLAPAMAERGWGSIVNISTMVASFGQAGMALYGASRAALELLTKAWAAEYGPSGVRVNAVSPGPTHTRMMEAVPEEMVNQLAALAPAGRVAEPEDSLPQSSFRQRRCQLRRRRDSCSRWRPGRHVMLSAVTFESEDQEANNNSQLGSIHMSAYVIVEFTVKDPDVYREKYAPIAGQTAKDARR